ncbi:hypothetical protein BJ741DRAFT_557176 [Chytriomyces cf. hyalinus JEL632]|nr:hypothetical protein BJ741DRAFT_557176 [Chytriomyces cf. hyalinus JEL632]
MDNEAAPTSRLMVRNLPRHLTLERLRDHFAQRGAVTDVKLAKDKDGNSRRFGFIGFKTVAEATAAMNHFKNTFIDTSRIEVVFAKPVGDVSIPRPWSKHAEGSSANARAIQRQQDRQKEIEEQQREKEAAAESKKKPAKTVLHELRDATTQDPKFKEFLDVMRPRGSAKGRTWANDDDIPSTGVDPLWDPNPAVKALVNDEDDADYQDLKLKDDAANEEGEDQEPEADAVAHNSALSDIDYLRSRMRAKLNDDLFGLEESESAAEQEMDVDEVTKESDEEMNEDEEVNSDEKQVPHSAEPAAPVKETGKAKMAQQIKDMFAEPEAKEIESSNILEEDLPARALLKGEDDIPPAEIIADTGRLFVKNLPYTCTVDDLKELFGKYGPLSEVHMSIDKDTKKPRGYAFILYLLPEHAVKAYTTLDSSIFQGRIIEILPGKEKPRAPEEDETLLSADASYKKKLEVKRKKEASNEYSWNSLFVNGDAVAEAMARKLNVKKSDILDPSSENMAVRLALAETDIVNETKQYLEEEGIDLNAFQRNKTRSNTILLCKNIPAHTTSSDIEALFAKFGALGRIIVPPSGTVAMVEFLEPNECKSAFRRLAYTKFKTLPLFLEYAPVGAFKTAFNKDAEAMRKATKGSGASENDADATEDSNMNESTESKQVDIDSRVAKAVAATSAAKSKKSDKKEVVEETMTSSMDDPDAMPVATLFVKNLSFDTTEDGLRKKFSPVGGLRSVRIATKPDTKKGGGALLSMGFGFLEFDRKEDAIKAVKALQNSELDGHKLQLKFSNAAAKGKSASASAGVKRNGTSEEEEVKVTGSKLIIRNIPFQATKKDIKQLFSTFGQVKSVRLPSKFDGSHRGFGFVDFLTKQEAKAAFSTLGSTHLYGRHLVMEWAEDESSVEAMRNKTAKKFTKDGEGGSKRRKVVLGNEDPDADATSD